MVRKPVEEGEKVCGCCMQRFIPKRGTKKHGDKVFCDEICYGVYMRLVVGEDV